MNKVIIMGRLTADPELRQTQSGIASCRFTVAVDRGFKDKGTGERQADFISCTAWRQTAEFVTRYFSKGQMIAVVGSLRTGSYQDRNHPDVTHYTTEVFVDNVEFCGSKNENERPASTTNTTSNSNNVQAMIRNAQNQGIDTQVQQQYNVSAMDGFEEIMQVGDVPF